MGNPIGRLEIPNRDGRTTSQVLVDKKGHIVDPPKWLNEKRRNPYVGRKSFIVPDLPYLRKGEKDA